MTRKKDSGSMLANANYKNALLHGAPGNAGANQNNAGGKGGNGSNNTHGRTKSQNAAGSVNLKLGAMQNYNVDNVSAVNLTYINSNIIVHHQKTKSSSNAPAGVRKSSARHT